MVEFALVAPVFFMLTIGLLDAGRAFYHYNALSHAAREAARYATVWGGSGHQGGLAAPGETPFNWSELGNCPNNRPAACPGVPSDTYPSLPYSNTQRIVGIATQASVGFDLGNLRVGIIAVPGSLMPQVNYPITVTLVYSFQPASSLLMGGRVIPISASSTMIVE